jgi:hypothetical protein
VKKFMLNAVVAILAVAGSYKTEVQGQTKSHPIGKSAAANKGFYHSTGNGGGVAGAQNANSKPMAAKLVKPKLVSNWSGGGSSGGNPYGNWAGQGIGTGNGSGKFNGSWSGNSSNNWNPYGKLAGMGTGNGNGNGGWPNGGNGSGTWSNGSSGPSYGPYGQSNGYGNSWGNGWGSGHSMNPYWPFQPGCYPPGYQQCQPGYWSTGPNYCPPSYCPPYYCPPSYCPPPSGDCAGSWCPPSYSCPPDNSTSQCCSDDPSYGSATDDQ